MISAQEDFDSMVDSVRNGTATGLIFITFGPEGKILLSGDPGQVVLALETAKLSMINMTQQAVQKSVLSGLTSTGNA